MLKTACDCRIHKLMDNFFLYTFRAKINLFNYGTRVSKWREHVKLILSGFITKRVKT